MSFIPESISCIGLPTVQVMCFPEDLRSRDRPRHSSHLRWSAVCSLECGWRTLRPVHGRTGLTTSWTCPLRTLCIGRKDISYAHILLSVVVAYGEPPMDRIGGCGLTPHSGLTALAIKLPDSGISDSARMPLITARSPHIHHSPAQASHPMFVSVTTHHLLIAQGSILSRFQQFKTFSIHKMLLLSANFIHLPFAPLLL